MGLASLERCPEDVFVPLPEELEGVLVGLLLDVVELELEPEPEPDPDPEPEPEPDGTTYGQGLQSGYDNPQVCPRRHVQAKPATGSRGQFWIPVHVLPPEPEPEPEPPPDGCISRMVCQSCFSSEWI